MLPALDVTMTDDTVSVSFDPHAFPANVSRITIELRQGEQPSVICEFPLNAARLSCGDSSQPETVIFDATLPPTEWPAGIKPWPDERGLTPRNASAGYLKDRNGYSIPVWHGDRLVVLHGVVVNK